MTLRSRSPRRVGFLYPGYRDSDFDLWRLGFLAALKNLSWIDGGNVHVEWRFAEYDRTLYAPLADDPIWSDVDVLVTGGTPLTHALRRARPSVSIVTSVGDPVGSGFANSLEEPGLNITGLSWGLREKARKQIGLLVEMAPTIRTLLILRSQRYGDIAELNACLDQVSSEQGLTAEIRMAESFAEIETAFASHGGLMTCGAIIYAHGAFQFDESTMARSAIRHGIAAVGDERRAAEAGCLMSYGMHHADQARSFASLVDRILRGEKPARMPFRLPEHSDFIVNRATAAALGLALSPDLLNRANAVIG
jgi:putative tryptophan/tyrosine transport system substrate-binding protein